MGFDDMENDKPDDGWNPEKEKREDPAKLAREAIELQKEGIAYLKSLREQNPTAPVIGRVYAPPPTPKQITVQVREIDNGFVLSRCTETYHGPGMPAQETYYQTIPQLLEGLEKVVGGAFLPPDPTPGVPEGT